MQKSHLDRFFPRVILFILSSVFLIYGGLEIGILGFYVDGVLGLGYGQST